MYLPPYYLHLFITLLFTLFISQPHSVLRMIKMFIYILIAARPMEALVHSAYADGEGEVSLANCGSVRREKDTASQLKSEKCIDVW